LEYITELRELANAALLSQIIDGAFRSKPPVISVKTPTRFGQNPHLTGGQYFGFVEPFSVKAPTPAPG
jgi:hypothetical protein